MIFLKPRHKPVFEMTVVRKICSFAEQNFFNTLNKRAESLALSLQTTCRINEINKKIITSSDNLDFDLQVASLKLDDKILKRKLENLLDTLEKFNSKIIEYKSPADLKYIQPGNYLFFSQRGQVPNLDHCHAFFAIENNIKLEIGLNKFQETNSGGQVLIGAAIL